MSKYRALISVSQKDGIVEFARNLVSLGYQILSTGGTASLLARASVPVTMVQDYTGFPEIMSGRVKTLHPKIFGGILARPNNDDDEQSLLDHSIGKIDMVVVNLYPFCQTIARQGCKFVDAIENIDIGGPSMIRAAAKNHSRLTVVVDPDDYPRILENAASNSGTIDLSLRQSLAAKAFLHTADYDKHISSYLNNQFVKESAPTSALMVAAEHTTNSLPDNFALDLVKQQALRYGENPSQQAALYVNPANANKPSLATAKLYQGKELSYNNLADADAAWRTVRQFSLDTMACVIVKHANPCGVALAVSQEQAYAKAYSTDSTSAFGGIIAFNTELLLATVADILQQQFVEVIVAPSIAAEALEALSDKPNIRVLIVGEQLAAVSQSPAGAANDAGAGGGELVVPASVTAGLLYKVVDGGVLVQTEDVAFQGKELSIVSARQPSDVETADLLFAWRVVKYVKSNAIVLVKDSCTYGIGAGQMSRIDSTLIALRKAEDAGFNVNGAVLASDAFFPFPDNVEMAAKAGISAIIQPGGSIRDAKVIAAADAAGIAMAFTGVRHFLH